jgi:hypothetical protein
VAREHLDQSLGTFDVDPVTVVPLQSLFDNEESSSGRQHPTDFP